MQKNKSGFTIIELLIVIVVIAILAAITIVTFNGVQQRALESAIASKESYANKQLETYKIDNGNYPADQQTFDSIIGQQVSDSIYTTYTSTPPHDSYTLSTGSTPQNTSTAFTDTSVWTLTVGAGATKTEGDEVWPTFVIGSLGLTGSNIYLTNARPISQLDNLDISWQVSTHGTNAGSQYFDVAILKGDIIPGFNYGGWNSNSARATVGYTGAGVWKTVRWQSTLDGDNMIWSVTLDGVSIGSGTKNISTWPSWRLIPINTYGNRNNVQSGVRGSITLPPL